MTQVPGEVAGPAPPPVPLPTRRGRPGHPPADLVALRSRGPLAHVLLPEGRRAWLLLTHDLARAVLTDPRFSVEVDPDYRPAPPGIFLRMDPPEHTRFRRLLAGRFSAGGTARLRPEIERAVDTRLAAVADAGPPVDLVAGFAVPVVTAAVGAVLGVPAGDIEEFDRLVTPAVTPGGPGYGDWSAVEGYVRALVAAGTGAGVVGATGDALTDEERVGVALMLVSAGHETTAGMISVGLVALLDHPDQLAALRAGRVPVDRAVEELLRYLTVVQRGAARTPVRDVEVAGRLIRAGELVIASLPLANRDPGRFTDPDRLDLDRDTAGHVAFGHGVHQCIGQHLARVVLRVALRGLLDRFPGIRSTLPLDSVPLLDTAFVYQATRLPVTW